MVPTFLLTQATDEFKAPSLDVTGNNTNITLRSFTNQGDVSTFFGQIISYIFFFLSIAAFIGIIYSGIMYITAGSDPAKAAAARNNLVWSVIGVVIAVLAYVIVRFVFGLTSSLIPWQTVSI